MADSDLPRRLELAGQLLFTETENEERLAIAAQSPSRRVAFSAVGDTCELCLALDGKVFLADSPEAAKYSPPLHINCDCLWVEVGDDEIGATDDFTPEDDAALAGLVEQHGHLMPDPEGQVRYAPLKVPAAPRGRDFTVRRVKDEATGELRTEIEWHRPRYELDLPPSPATGRVPVQTGVSETGPGWAPVGRLDALRPELPGDSTARGPSGGRPDRRNVSGLANMRVTDADDAAVAAHLDDLNLLPKRLFENLAGERVQVRVGRGSVVDLGNADLADEHPPLWGEGTTLRDVGGLYRSDNRTLTIGTSERGGSFSRALHEVGHAVGDVFGLDASLELERHHTRLFDQLPQALRAFGQTRAGRRELLAEGVALVVKNETLARMMFDDDFVDWVLAELGKLSV